MNTYEILIKELNSDKIERQVLAADNIAILIEKSLRIRNRNEFADCDELLPFDLREIVLNLDEIRTFIFALRDLFLRGKGSVSNLWALGKAYMPEATSSIIDIILALGSQMSSQERMQALYSLSHLVEVKECRIDRLSEIRDWLELQSYDNNLSQPEMAKFIIRKMEISD